jgi:hypothetical protein
MHKHLAIRTAPSTLSQWSRVNLIIYMTCDCIDAQSGGAGHVAGEEHALGGEAAALRHSGSAGGDLRLQVMMR